MISGILGDLSKDYPQVKDLARNWSELASPTQAMRGCVMDLYICEKAFTGKRSGRCVEVDTTR